MEHLYFIFLLFSVTLFTYNEVEGLKVEKIVGGMESNGTEHKYVVAVMLKTGLSNIPDQVVCAGAIVGNWYVATIADCFYNGEGMLITKEFYIMAATTDVYIPSKSVHYRNISLVIIPKDYNPHATNPYSSEGNLAVIKVDRAFALRRAHPHLRKLRLSHDKSVKLYREYNLAAFGWTTAPKNQAELTSFLVDQEDPERSVGKLRINFAYISNHPTCRHDIGDTVAESYMCVRISQFEHEKFGICRGDGGAPLVHNFQIKGIAISGFPDCNENNKPAIYLNIGYYYTFIDTAMAGTIDRGTMRAYELKSYNGTYQFEEKE